MKEEVKNYLANKNLEEHISPLIEIIDKNNNKKTSPVRPVTKKKGSKEILFENEFFTIIKDFHTKDKVDIWVIKLNRKVWLEKNDFEELKELVECYDGYYSGYSGGFIFMSMPDNKTIKEITELIESLI